MAFHPDFQSNGLVYAYYTDEDNGDIVDLGVPDQLRGGCRRGDRARGHPRSATASPRTTTAATITFGPNDGYMYISTGDGGSGDDPRENAQDKESLLGKLIRIDPLESGGDPYTVPGRQPLRRQEGRRRDLRHRASATPSASTSTPDDRQHHDRRRRAEPLRRGRHRDRGFASQGQLRLGPLGGLQEVERRRHGGRAKEEQARQARPRLQPLQRRFGDRRGRRARRGSHQPLRALPLHRLLRGQVPQLRAAAHQGRRLRGARHRDQRGSPPSPRTRSPTRSTSPRDGDQALYRLEPDN